MAVQIVNMAEKPQPQVKIGHYIIGDTLGVGTFGKVKRKLLCSCIFSCTFEYIFYRQTLRTNRSKGSVDSSVINSSISSFIENDLKNHCPDNVIDDNSVLIHNDLSLDQFEVNGNPILTQNDTSGSANSFFDSESSQDSSTSVLMIFLETIGLTLL